MRTPTLGSLLCRVHSPPRATLVASGPCTAQPTSACLACVLLATSAVTAHGGQPRSRRLLTADGCSPPEFSRCAAYGFPREPPRDQREFPRSLQESSYCARCGSMVGSRRASGVLVTAGVTTSETTIGSQSSRCGSTFRILTSSMCRPRQPRFTTWLSRSFPAHFTLRNRRPNLSALCSRRHWLPSPCGLWRRSRCFTQGLGGRTSSALAIFLAVGPLDAQ